MNDEPDLERRLGAWASAPNEAADWEDVLRRAGVPRWRPARPRPTLAFAFAALVVTAVVGVVLAYGTRPSATGPAGPTGATGVSGPTGTDGPTGPTLAHPLGGDEVSLGDAENVFGGRIVLPDTPQVGPADVGKVWLTPSYGPTLRRINAVVAVTFPAAGVWVDYERGVNVYADDVLLEYQEIAHQNTGFAVINLHGVPALAHARTDQASYGGVTFSVEGMRVSIIGRADLSTMEAMAQSIVDRSEAPSAGELGNVGGIQLFPYFLPARKIDLAAASSTLGAPVVLPDTSLAKPSDALAVWAERTCPAPEGSATDFSLLHACWIWISFPSAGLSIGYLRGPLYRGYKHEWDMQARNYGANARVVQLSDVPALAIEPQNPYPGSIEFDLNGTRVVVAGNYDTATLQTVAQSIVDRAGG